MPRLNKYGSYGEASGMPAGLIFKPTKRRCLSCNEEFWKIGKWNCVCGGCKRSEDWGAPNVRQYQPDIMRDEYCSECRRTVNKVRIEEAGKVWYVCAGNVRAGLRGCGHRVEWKGGKDKWQQ